MSEHEYAFDATFAAVVRVSAPSEQSARDALGRLLDCASINVILFDLAAKLRITEVSVHTITMGILHFFLRSMVRMLRSLHKNILA